MSVSHTAAFWLVATLAAYVLSRIANHYVRSWWTSPLLLTCVLCLGMTVVLHTGYREYMRGGQWLLMLLGPATVAFALPIYEQRALLRRHWPPLLVGVLFGCGLALGGSWLLSGLLQLPESMDDCKKLLKLVLESPSVTRTNALVQETIFRQFPDELMFYSSLLDREDSPAH